MTINELITELQRRRDLHGGDTIVRATWEGIVRELDMSNIYFVDDKWACLWIDADDNFYKPEDAI